MVRLPQPGSDNGIWGDILNEFLLEEHNADGTLKIRSEGVITGAQQRSALTAKGDLYAATAPGTTTRLGVGANGQVLTADSSQATGIKWAPTVNSGAAALGLISHTFDPWHGAEFYPVGSGLLVACLIYLPATTITTLGIGLRSAGASSTGSNTLALYRRDSATVATQVAETVDMTTEFTGSAPVWASGAISGGPITVTAGVYYIAALTHFGTPPEVATTRDLGYSLGISSPAINGHRMTLYAASQTSFPATFNPSTYTANTVQYYLTVN